MCGSVLKLFLNEAQDYFIILNIYLLFKVDHRCNHNQFLKENTKSGTAPSKKKAPMAADIKINDQTVVISRKMTNQMKQNMKIEQILLVTSGLKCALMCAFTVVFLL